MCVFGSLMMSTCIRNVCTFIDIDVINVIISIHRSDVQMKTFLETMHTRFGKISTKKSGQGLKKLSHREKFIE